MTNEPTVQELTRTGGLNWFDDTIQKRPGEVTIDPSGPVLYDFARAVRWARKTGRWRGYGWPCATWPGTRAEWAENVVQFEVSYLKRAAESRKAVCNTVDNGAL